MQGQQCQSLRKDYEEKLSVFQAFFTEKIEPDHIINMDEVPLTFNQPLNRTIEQKRVPSVSIKTTVREKASFIMELAVAGAGTKLPWLVICKQKRIPNE